MTSNVMVSNQSIETRNQLLHTVQDRVLWLAVNMVHHANQVRPNPDGLKVGGHQASSSSVATLLTSLYFDFMKTGDKIAIKPHASPVYHAIQYLLGNLEPEYLLRLRDLHGLQAYPSRTKDPRRRGLHHRLGGPWRCGPQLRRMGGQLHRKPLRHGPAYQFEVHQLGG